MFISTVLPKILAFLNAQGIGMHTAVSETTPHTFGRGDAYSLTVTSYQLVISYQFHDWGKHHTKSTESVGVSTTTLYA